MISIINKDIFETECYAILHQCNCRGKMGSGIALEIKKRYPVVYNLYKLHCDTYNNNTNDLLGKAVYVNTKYRYDTPFDGIYNCFAQDGYGYDGRTYTNYDALFESFHRIRQNIVHEYYGNAEHPVIAIPYKIGCCRGGGDWSVVKKIINDVFDDESGIDVLICKIKE